jgi:hypothetical protein
MKPEYVLPRNRSRRRYIPRMFPVVLEVDFDRNSHGIPGHDATMSERTVAHSAARYRVLLHWRHTLVYDRGLGMIQCSRIAQ